ncbi:MAG: hypothetical protein ACI88C_000032 [Acidimicrobiales bacterium]|jgi:hypothetical protein
MSNIAIGWMLCDTQGRPHMISTEKGPVLEVNMAPPPDFGPESPVIASQVRVLPAVPGWARGPVGNLGVLEIPLPPGTTIEESQWNEAIEESGLAEAITKMEHRLIELTAVTTDSDPSGLHALPPSASPSSPIDSTPSGDTSGPPAAEAGN